MGRIEDTSATRRTTATNIQTQPEPPKPPPPPPPRNNRTADNDARLAEVNQYSANRQARIERDAERRENPIGSLTAGATRGARAASTEISERGVRNTGRVFVDGTPEFRARVEHDLNRIAPGTTIGTDGVVRRSAQQIPGHEQGYRLVDQLLNNPNPVTIRYERGNASAGALNVTNANGTIGRPGNGSGAVVKYDPAGNFALPVRGADGRVTNQPADSAVVLAHELIHASHYQRGTRDPRSGAPTGQTLPPDSVNTTHFVNDSGQIFREAQSTRVRMREEFRTVGFDGYRRSDEPTELSIRNEFGQDPRASYMHRTSYEPATRLDQIFGDTRLRATNAATTIADGVTHSRRSAAIGGGAAFATTAYQQLQNGELDAAQLAGNTALGVGTGVTEEVIERAVSGAPSVTSGMTNSTFRVAARQLRGAGVAGAVTGSAFAIYDNYSAYQNNEISGAQFAGRVAGEAVTSAGAGMAGAYAGAVIGSFIPIPVVGTLAGAAVGFAAGYLADKALRGLGVDKLIATGVEKAVEFGQNVVSSVGETASNFVSGARDTLGNIGSGAVNTLASIFG
ncbi:MAG TPA: M91 family zinc metallopeptidase [Pyrinomonadaceae bacterium]|nr:M91 family zinc metallopeptidase [Pyrinomonadaceae bacterium]